MRYTELMSADEDLNEFNSWDCGGAAIMLALVPAVLYYVFSDHEYMGTVTLGGIAVGVGVVVFLVAHFTRSRVVGRLMQLVGIALCVLYWCYAIHMWATHNRVHLPDAVAPAAAAQPAV